MTSDAAIAATRARMTIFAAGDRVCGGECGTEDYDEGIVIAVDGDQVDVGWDSGFRTTQPASLLRLLERRGEGLTDSQRRVMASPYADIERLILDHMARVEPFCACGRIISLCDGSRRGCGKTPKP